MTDVVAVARLFEGWLIEAGANHGARVEGVQHWALGESGDSWCDEWAVGFVLDIAFKGKSPFPRKTDTNAAVEQTRQFAAAQGWLVDSPSIGDLVVSINSAGIGHHIAIVTQLSPLTAIAGNTSSDGISSNGTGVYEHAISPINKVYIHYPRA